LGVGGGQTILYCLSHLEYKSILLVSKLCVISKIRRPK
jgi:hypothetical protein